MNRISLYLPFVDAQTSKQISDSFRSSDLIENICWIALEKGILPENEKVIVVEEYLSSATMRGISSSVETDYFLFSPTTKKIAVGYFAIERIIQVAESTGAALVYSDYLELQNGKTQQHSLIDRQLGSIRDDFDLGSLMLIKKKIFCDAVKSLTQNFKYAGWYDVTLRLSELGALIRIPEFLYTSS